MTEEEAKKALFKVHEEYMMHSAKEREKLYDEYMKKRKEIKKALTKLMMEKIETEKNKTK